MIRAIVFASMPSALTFAHRSSGRLWQRPCRSVFARMRVGSVRVGCPFSNGARLSETRAARAASRLRVFNAHTATSARCRLGAPSHALASRAHATLDWSNRSSLRPFSKRSVLLDSRSFPPVVFPLNETNVLNNDRRSKRDVCHLPKLGMDGDRFLTLAIRYILNLEAVVSAWLRSRSHSSEPGGGRAFANVIVAVLPFEAPERLVDR